MMSLGEHLRADQYPRRAAVHAVENGLHGAACSGRVPVQARQRRVGEQPRQRLLDALRALAHRVQGLAAAAAARRARARGAPQ